MQGCFVNRKFPTKKYMYIIYKFLYMVLVNESSYRNHSVNITIVIKPTIKAMVPARPLPFP